METQPRIVDVPVPASWDAPGADLFREFSTATDQILAAIWGTSDRSRSADARLASLQDDDYMHYECYLAYLGDRIVGRGWLMLPQLEDLESAWFSVEVFPASEGQGAGRALADHGEARAAAAGRHILYTVSDHTAADSEVSPEQQALVPRTGAGQIPAENRAAVFARRRGFDLEQLERSSVLDVSAETLALARELETQAAARAGEEFELLLFTGPVPAELVPGILNLRTAMSRDVPQGELGFEEEKWDESRLRSEEEVLIKGGVEEFASVARHRASGVLAGLSYIHFDPARPEVASQEDTVVLREFRGYRLGQWMKSGNLFQLHSRHPEVERVRTSNADENQHMLAINTAMGFRPDGFVGMWKRSEREATA